MSITIPLIIAVTGCIALLIGLSGGGVKAKEVSVPKITPRARVISSFIGLMMVVLASWLYVQNPGQPTNPLGLPTKTINTVTPLPSEPQTSTPAKTLGAISTDQSTLASIPETATQPSFSDPLFPKENCIDASIWKTGNDISHLPDNNNCMALSDWGLSINNRSLNITLGVKDATRHYGIYTSLPDGNLEIHFTLTINNLYSPRPTTAQVLEFGVIDSQDISRGTFLFYKETYPDRPIDLGIGNKLLPFNLCGTYSPLKSKQDVVLFITNSILTVPVCSNRAGPTHDIILTNRAFWIGWQHYNEELMDYEISNIMFVIK